jgi:DNA-binding transcriptional ArsR family regulator
MMKDKGPALVDRGADQAAEFLRGLTNGNRLKILCLLVEGEKNVTELEARLGLRQPSLSQQLSRLRKDGLVHTRREAKHIYYSLASDPALDVIALLHDRFCAPEALVEGR